MILASYKLENLGSITLSARPDDNNLVGGEPIVAAFMVSAHCLFVNDTHATDDFDEAKRLYDKLVGYLENMQVEYEESAKFAKQDFELAAEHDLA